MNDYYVEATVFVNAESFEEAAEKIQSLIESAVRVDWSNSPVIEIINLADNERQIAY